MHDSRLVGLEALFLSAGNTPSFAGLQVACEDDMNRRSDFAAKAEVVRQEMAKGLVIGLVTLIAAPPARRDLVTCGELRRSNGRNGRDSTSM